MDKSFVPPYTLAGMPENTPVLLGLSGGADSTALFDMLAADCGARGARFYAAHINHLIRGAEADADEEFCRRLAENNTNCAGFFVLREDVPALAAKSGRSLEHEARLVRYGFFEKIMKENSIPILATAHNADDNIETLIFNITRGCALRGLCGIPPVRTFGNGVVVRPILGMSKAEILDYCGEHGLRYVTDATNSDTVYSRNRIRAKVIPELAEINPSVRRGASRMCQALRDDEDYLDSEAAAFVVRYATDKGFPLDKLRSVHPAIAVRAVMKLYPTENMLEYTHASAIMSMIKSGKSRFSLSLPGKIKSVACGGYLNFTGDGRQLIQNRSSDYDIPLKIGANIIPGTDFALFLCDSETLLPTDINIYKLSTEAYINSDRINDTLSARPRRAGDLMRHGGVGKKIRRLMNEAEIPTDIRDDIPIVCGNGEIVWLPYGPVCDGWSRSGKPGSRAYLIALYTRCIELP